MPGTDMTLPALPDDGRPWVHGGGYAGPDRRGDDRESMGMTGRAKQLSNVAAIAIIASIALTLIGVVVTVMWVSLRQAAEKSDQLVAAIQQQTSASQKREDMIREMWLRDSGQQRETIAAMTAATNAATHGVQSKLDAMVLAMIAEREKDRQIMEQVLEQLKLLNKTAAKKPLVP